jgi:hypothetical protein
MEDDKEHPASECQFSDLLCGEIINCRCGAQPIVCIDDTAQSDIIYCSSEICGEAVSTIIKKGRPVVEMWNGQQSGPTERNERGHFYT